MINVTSQEIQEGRKQYQDFFNRRSGDFYTNLFHAIAFADQRNINLLATAFPGAVFAYLEYTDMLNRVRWMVDGKLYVRAGDHL
jgi:hypothetical protein